MTETDGVICAAPTCENPVPAQRGRGRRAIYCSPPCRPTAQQHTHRLEVDIDHQVTELGERPTGRVWSVQLRRGNRNVVVATELGRPSAEHLAAQISALLNDRPQRQEMPSTKI